MKDEGPFLLEWIAYHRLIGVTDFLIYSNDCSDGTDALLEALAAAGIVTHVPQIAPKDKSIQWQALNAAWRHPLRKAADWMLVSDVDEFPVVHAGMHRLADLLGALPEVTDAVALSWRLFGSSGVVDFSGRPVVQDFTNCAPPDMIHPIAATFFKSLFRPSAFARPGVHRPRHKEGSSPVWVDGSGRALPPIIAGNDKRMSLVGLTGCNALAEMHHYSLRSAESFVVKAQRGLPNRTDKAIDLGYWVERNFNTQPNQAMLHWLPALMAEIAVLSALPGVAEIHESSRQWHAATFAALLAQPGPYRLFCNCLHAGDSRVLPPALARRLLNLFQQLR